MRCGIYEFGLQSLHLESVTDRQRFDADPDPTFDYIAGPNSDPEWILLQK